MDQAMFERLLFEEESDTLDFKRDQYPFAKATEDDKSELLKDILGFANAWRRTEAFILIGVEDVRGGRSIVRGVADHLDDHSLQQFVNNLANQPVRFRYEALSSDGKQVGIIRIEQQPRPIYLKRDYGKLKKEKVYVRRGSATNPNQPATLEEIARMGQAHLPQPAELTIQFAHLIRNDSIGSEAQWEAVHLEMPSSKEIPDLVPRRTKGPLGIDFEYLGYGNRLNSEYYRDLANYTFTKFLFHPVRLVAKNVGQEHGRNVHCEFEIPANSGIYVIDEADFPDLPSENWDHHLGSLANKMRVIRHEPGFVKVDSNDERIRIEIDFGDMQPGRKVWSDKFYIALLDSGKGEMAGKLFAANLPGAKEFVLTLSAEVTRQRILVRDLMRIVPSKS